MSLPASQQAAGTDTDVPWGAWTGIGAVVLAVFVQLLAVTATEYLPASMRKTSIWFSMALYQFLAFGVLLAAVVLIFSRYHVGPASLGFRWRGWNTLGRAAGAVVLVYIGIVVISWIFVTFLPSYKLSGNSQELTQGSGTNLHLWQIAIVALFVAVEAPLVEETLFRGILFQGLRRSFNRITSRSAAVLASALCSGVVFGLLHGEIHTLPILAFVGFALAYVFYLSDTIYGSMTVHGIFNFVGVVTIFHAHL